MVWGYNEEDRPWHDDINDPVSDQYEVILGFNEPNHADQSDIPPEVAASAWLELQNMYPDKVRNTKKKEITFKDSIRFWSVQLLQAEIPTGLIRSLRCKNISVRKYFEASSRRVKCWDAGLTTSPHTTTLVTPTR